MLSTDKQTNKQTDKLTNATKNITSFAKEVKSQASGFIYKLTLNHFADYLLGKGGYVFGSVGLSVCLSVDNITQKVMNGLG